MRVKLMVLMIILMRHFEGFFWGDPHLTTFDGASYTFNGLGEYYLVYAPDVITIQARTKRVLKEDGAESDATGFVAVVVKDHTNDLSGKVHQAFLHEDMFKT